MSQEEAEEQGSQELHAAEDAVDEEYDDAGEGDDGEMESLVAKLAALASDLGSNKQFLQELLETDWSQDSKFQLDKRFLKAQLSTSRILRDFFPKSLSRLKSA